MKFAIITHALHKKNDSEIYAYEPYVREMNLWLKYVDDVKIIAPFSNKEVTKIEVKYNHSNILCSIIPSFNILSFFEILKSILKIPVVILKIFKAMFWADHIHLRCPGNIGLLGCFVQILFPKKPKTVKYAGNWDPKSKQPLSYRLQKWILSNTFLTRNCKVLVYGKWDNQSKNIVSFFTASYTDKEKQAVLPKTFVNTIKFIFVGAFTAGKQPLLSVKVIEELLSKNRNVHLDMYGSGKEFNEVKDYISNNLLENNITLHGNQSKKSVKKAYQKAHFLIFISKSEGWPKVVAEAMFWKCLPISSNVSCLEYMLDKGNRGVLLESNVGYLEISNKINNLISNEEQYHKMVNNAVNWSQNFTLDKFEEEIKKFLI